ncbi:uncharacterized protein TNCV_381411 [Trichonephila clavipes]|uniref:Uncharacterized protein n=1 Tax=Trichonephila clavipes TaxID=2585209 RepID=A0A8X6SCD6_TRICX|nr:uncharacterized protein TNCV_381411 [Trichonephila clavipes]
MPRRDRPYIVLSQRSPTTFVVASCDKPDEPLGVYHTSALTPFLNGTETQSPVVPLKKRGRPRKQPLVPRGTAGENAIRSASTPLGETVFGGVGENVTTTFKPCLPLMISGSQGHHLFFREAGTRSSRFCPDRHREKMCTRGVRESLFPSFSP